jgi:hypothetical protein
MAVRLSQLGDRLPRHSGFSGPGIFPEVNLENGPKLSSGGQEIAFERESETGNHGRPQRLGHVGKISGWKPGV